MTAPQKSVLSLKREPRNDVFSKFDPFPNEEIGGFADLQYAVRLRAIQQ